MERPRNSAGLILPKHVEAALREERASEGAKADSPQMAPEHFDEIVNSVPVEGLLLEWGSGMSTVEAARRFRDAGQNQMVCSVEHDPAWAELVTKRLLAENLMDFGRVVLARIDRPVAPMEAGWHRENPAGLEDYLIGPVPLLTEGLAPLGVGRSPRRVATVLVDGIARGACLAVLASFAPAGLSVFLHDAERPWYTWALLFPVLEEVAVREPGTGHPGRLYRMKTGRRRA